MCQAQSRYPGSVLTLGWTWGGRWAVGMGRALPRVTDSDSSLTLSGPGGGRPGQGALRQAPEGRASDLLSHHRPLGPDACAH